MYEKFRKLIQKEDGQSLIIFVLLLTILLGFAALVLDVGIMSLSKSKLQNAADAAALAGVQELPDNPVEAKTSAQHYAAINGQSSDSTTVKVATNNSSVSVEVSRTTPMFLGKLLGVDISTVSAKATASIGVAASVPWIVPFVIAKPATFVFDKVYVMRMYGGGDFIDYPITYSNRTGYPSGYNYPSDYRNDPVYKDYPITDPYPYQFDYMNVYIEKNTNFNNYIYWLKNGYHETFSINETMYYYAPSSGGKESVDAFAKRVAEDPNEDYTKAKLGDKRVMLIPIVDSMLKRSTSTRGNVPIEIIGFVGFFIEEVHKNSYGQSFWFEGRFLENFDIGSGEVTFDLSADFGLRVQKLTE